MYSQLISHYGSVAQNHHSTSRPLHYIAIMPIKSIAGTSTKRIYDGLRAVRLPLRGQIAARRALRILDNAQDLADLQCMHPKQLDEVSLHYSSDLAGGLGLTWRWSGGDAYSVRIAKPDQ